MGPAPIPNALPFYSTTTPQLNNLRWCNGALLFRHTFPVGEIPPFVIKKSDATAISQVLLVPVANPDEHIDVSAYATPTSDTGSEGTSYYESMDFNVTVGDTVYPGDYTGGGPPILTGWEPTYAQWVDYYSGGPFYLRVKSAGIQYSEIFYQESIVTGQPDENCNTIIIEWNDTCAIGELRYDLLTITNKVYLSAETTRPEYEYEERGQEDGNNVFTPVWQKVRKRSKIETLIPEYLADAMAHLPMHSSVTITDQYGDAYVVSDVEFNVSWESPCYARAEIAFSIDYTVKRCC